MRCLQVVYEGHYGGLDASWGEIWCLRLDGHLLPTLGPTTRAWGPCKSLGLLFAEEASSRDLLIGHSLALELAKVLALELSPSPLQPWSPIQPCGACGAWAPANFLPNCSTPDERPPPPSQWIHFNPRETRAISGFSWRVRRKGGCSELPVE